MKQTRVISWISREVPAAVTRHKVLAGIVVVLVFLAVVIYVPRLPLVGPRSGREAESAFRGHLLQALAGLVLAAGAYYTGRTFALNREGQITERFTRAVEQLADEKLDIRLGGIYALERIARDSETHYEPVMEVLTAFLREHTRSLESPLPSSASDVRVGWATVGPKGDLVGRATFKPGEETGGFAVHFPELRVDFQAVATVLGRRARQHEQPGYSLDLRWVRLVGVSLVHAPLARADFSGADLSWANLSGADLSGADFLGANLSGANLSGANIAGTDLSMAKLSRTSLLQVIGLTREQLASAKTDKHTQLPDDLDREAGG
jgi:hypothetical protein